MQEITQTPFIADPWQRQKGESSKAFNAFCEYRDMGKKRTIAKVAEKLGKSVKNYEHMSRRNHWVVRARAYDNHTQRAHVEERVEAIRDMEKRHANSIKSALTTLQMPRSYMLKLLHKAGSVEALFNVKRTVTDEFGVRKVVEEDRDPVEVMRLVRECERVMPELMRMERLALGESTEKIAHEMPDEDVVGKDRTSVDRIDEYEDLWEELDEEGKGGGEKSQESA